MLKKTLKKIQGYRRPKKNVVINEISYPSKDRRLHMRQSPFTDSQIMLVLKRAKAAVQVPDLCRENCIS